LGSENYCQKNPAFSSGYLHRRRGIIALGPELPEIGPAVRQELLAGKALPFGIIGMGDWVLVTTVAVPWFDVPLRGSLPLLFMASLLYVMVGLGMGLLISTVSKTQQEAFMGTFFVFMPALLLSGFMFPVSSMLRIFQKITILNPVRHYIEIVRMIFLKGISFDVLWPQFVALLLLGLALLTLATSSIQTRSGVDLDSGSEDSPHTHTTKAPQVQDLEGQAEPVGLEPTSPLGRRFSRPVQYQLCDGSKNVELAFRAQAWPDGNSGRAGI
jgi:hypothetical protein